MREIFPSVTIAGASVSWPPRAISAAPAPANRGSILVVDDEERLAHAYKRYLVSRGFEVAVAHDGVSALEAFRAGAFEAIISDLAMPRMNGIALLAAVRETDRDIPFVLVTAAATTESAVKAVEYGALRYLLKPVSLADLAKTAEDAVTTSRAARYSKRACVIATHVDEEAKDKAKRKGALRRAIESLYLVYQPIISWPLRSVHGYEALARSREPSFPHPGVLFEEAERLSQVEVVGRAVRKNVVDVANAAPKGALLFVNIHPKDLDDSSLYDVNSPLSKIANRVVLEITERASIDDIDGLQSKISALRSMGYRIALDDIGAGYANLVSFALLEPEIVKLDMALVRDVHKTPTKQRLVRSLVTLCRDLKIDLIAEGVETTDERDVLVSLGCELFQGYLFAKPGEPFPVPRL